MTDESRLDEARHAFREAELRQLNHSTKIIESQLDLWDRCVSFEDELFDQTTGQCWTQVGMGAWSNGAASAVYRTEADLDRIRNQGRYFADENPFAISGHENRINYVIGTGHQYTVSPQDEKAPGPDLIGKVTAVINAFVKLNGWTKRQKEMLRRFDRDGEVFLRFFEDTLEGTLKVRFVEPERIRNPQDNPVVGGTRFGILFEPGDDETAEAYLVYPHSQATEPDEIPATEIQHRKANVDSTAARGIPLYYPVRSNLRRAVTILRNMSRASEIQTAIAMVREHVQANKAKVQAYVDDIADVSVTSSATGKTRTYRDYPPGTVLDHGPGTKYTFPVEGIDIAKFVAGIQAELRAIACRLVMPEFMLTSDASNANYASTMVAEGPATKEFKSLQATVIEDDIEVVERAVEVAIAAGDLPGDTLEQVQITAEPPRVETRDRLKDAQADQILQTAGILSDQTFSGRHELDYQHEQDNMEQAQEQETGFAGPGDEDSGDDPEDGDGGPVGSSSGVE